MRIKRSNRRGVADSKKAVTGIDVLFGDDAVEARPGWAITGTPLLLDTGSSIPVPQLTVRRGPPPPEVPKPVPRIQDNGRFKIMQLADLHLNTGVGVCRDALPPDWNNGHCEADRRTMDFVARILDDEKPDLVVLSGDQVNGDLAPDAQTAIFKYAQLLIEHKVPYVSIFGNHDDEGTMSRPAQMEIIESLPYSLSTAGPPDIDGVGNYYIEILARGSSGHSAITVYLLDSHAYSPDERRYKGYDWIKQNQIDWFRSTAQSLKKAHKEYTHHHMDVAFIHIPLPEYANPDNVRVGNWSEPSTAPAFNSGFYDALVEEGVLMVSCGQ
jgi:3',5'-cyclic AMP phosphodiesterase CpdA